MYESLAENGLIAIVEFRLEDEGVPIRREHKMSKVQIAKEFGGNGFKLLRSYDKLPWQHLLFFGKVIE